MLPGTAVAKVNGRNVITVEFGHGEESLGEFRQSGERAWREISTSGGNSFDFVETHRDQWSVYLDDPTRGVQIQLDLHRGKVLYGEGGGEKRDLYDILTRTSATVATNSEQGRPQGPRADMPQEQPQAPTLRGAAPTTTTTRAVAAENAPTLRPPPQPTATSTEQSSAPPAAKAFATTLLREHNRMRAEVGVGPMRWSDEVTRYAQEWADSLASEGCGLRHRPNLIYGENLYGGFGQGTRTPSAPTRAWEKEKPDYDGGPMNRKNFEAGHYTQVVWRKSTGLGCARASCEDGSHVVVCNYEPRGNQFGEQPY